MEWECFDAAEGAAFGDADTVVLYLLIKCKAMIEATISSKNQIVVPKEVRKALGIKAGDKLLVQVHGGTVIMMAKPKDHLKALKGIVPPGTYGDDYVRKERNSWD